MWTIIGYALASVFLLFFLGYGLTSFAIPVKLKPHAFWLSPWFFIIFLIFVLTTASLAGISVSQASPFLIVFLTGLTIFTFLKTKKPFNFFTNKDIIIALFVFGSILLNLSPLILKDHFLTTISFGNNDAIAYATTADYLKNNSLFVSFYSNIILTVYNLLHDGYRWGPSLLEAFFLNLFSLDGYQFTYLLQVILYAVIVPLPYVLLRIIYKDSRMILIFISFLMVFNANLLYMLYNVFSGITLFWGISLFLLIFYFTYIESKDEKTIMITMYDIIIGLTIVSLYISYHETAIFMLAPLIIFLIIRSFLRKSSFDYFRILMKITLIAFMAGSIAIFNAIVFDFDQAFLSTNNQPIGWQLFRQKVPFANPFEMMGLYSIHNFEPMRNLFAIPLSIAVVAVIVVGFLQSKQKWLLASFIIVDVFFLYWTGIHHKNFFDYNRVVTYTLPVFLVLFTIGAYGLLSHFHNTIRSSVIFLLIILVVFSGMKLNRRFTTVRVSVDRSFIILKDIKEKNIKEPIYAGNSLDTSLPIWTEIWIGYFVYSPVVDGTLPTVFLHDKFAHKVPDNSLVLIPKSLPRSYSPKLLLKNILWENDYYKLGRLCNSDGCLLSRSEDLSGVEIGKSEFEDSLLTSGWNVKENGNRSTQSSESTLRLVAKHSNYSNLILVAKSLEEPQEISVYFDGEYLGTREIKTDWEILRFPLANVSYGVRNILFKYSPIDLSVNFKMIKFE